MDQYPCRGAALDARATKLKRGWFLVKGSQPSASLEFLFRTPEGVPYLKSFTTAGGGCATFFLRESFFRTGSVGAVVSPMLKAGKIP
jgi:hypothetical protein